MLFELKWTIAFNSLSLVHTNDEELKVIVLLIKKGLAIEEEFEQMPILF